MTSCTKQQIYLGVCSRYNYIEWIGTSFRLLTLEDVWKASSLHLLRDRFSRPNPLLLAQGLSFGRQSLEMQYLRRAMFQRVRVQFAFTQQKPSVTINGALPWNLHGVSQGFDCLQGSGRYGENCFFSRKLYIFSNAFSHGIITVWWRL